MDILCIIGGALLILLARKQQSPGFVTLGWIVLSVGAIWFGWSFWWGYQLSRALSSASSGLRSSYETPALADPQCKVEQWTWQNRTSYLVIEGVLSAPTRATTIHIQAYDANGRFLGNGLDYLAPGGSFHVMINQPSPTSELSIKYSCG